MSVPFNRHFYFNCQLETTFTNKIFYRGLTLLLVYHFVLLLNNSLVNQFRGKASRLPGHYPRSIDLLPNRHTQPYHLMHNFYASQNFASLRVVISQAQYQAMSDLKRYMAVSALKRIMTQAIHNCLSIRGSRNITCNPNNRIPRPACRVSRSQSCLSN